MDGKIDAPKTPLIQLSEVWVPRDGKPRDGEHVYAGAPRTGYGACADLPRCTGGAMTRIVAPLI